VDLVTKGFQVLCHLVQDLEFDEANISDQSIPFADQLDILCSYTPWQRMRMLIASIPLVDVLFTLLCSSYKKVTILYVVVYLCVCLLSVLSLSLYFDVL